MQYRLPISILCSFSLKQPERSSYSLSAITVVLAILAMKRLACVLSAHYPGLTMNFKGLPRASIKTFVVKSPLLRPKAS